MRPIRRHRPPRGASMIEAMVALLVLSFSALGYAALQVKGVSSNASALTRSKATQLVAEMSDRVRANRSARTTYQTFTSSVSKPACGGVGTPCGITEMAQLDFALWREKLQQWASPHIVQQSRT